MIHPYREELAGRCSLPTDLIDRKIVVRMVSELLEIISRGGPIEHTPAQDFALDALRDLRDAVMNPAAVPSYTAAALRQSPSVEEVARVIAAELLRQDDLGAVAREIDKLYQRGGG